MIDDGENPEADTLATSSPKMRLVQQIVNGLTTMKYKSVERTSHPKT